MSQRERQKGETRTRIVGSAIRHLKTEGLSTASVSDIMDKAGLTVGGFYAHFASKDQLAGEAVRDAMAERRGRFLDRYEGLDWCERTCSAIREYFQPAHRDDPANGCPLSMSAMEAARNRALGPAFIEELARFAEAVRNGRRTRGQPAPPEAALGTLALMVGGMILARATKGSPVSDEILEAARAFGAAAVRDLSGTSPEAAAPSQTVKGDFDEQD
jgi:TetR/AcrR family transcriptional repressor of nem operon